MGLKKLYNTTLWQNKHIRLTALPVSYLTYCKQLTMYLPQVDNQILRIDPPLPRLDKHGRHSILIRLCDNSLAKVRHFPDLPVDPDEPLAHQKQDVNVLKQHRGVDDVHHVEDAVDDEVR